MVKIRLKRMGRKHLPTYRLAAVDSRATRDGRVLEELGHYDPADHKNEPAGKLKAERIQYWLGVGAKPTETVANLLKKVGIKAPAPK